MTAQRASDLRFLRRVCALMAERVAPEAMAKVRVRDVVARQELAALRTATLAEEPGPALSRPRLSHKTAPDVTE